MDMSIGEKIRYRRKQLGYTLEEVAVKVGVSIPTISKWERGESESIKDKYVIKLADVLSCNLLWLYDLDDAVTVDGGVLELPKIKTIPIIGEIACGDPILAVENHDGQAGVPENSPADFALRCKGDSMINARIFPGDLVLIRQQPDVDSGEIAAVMIDGEATLKRVFKYEGRIELRAENPLYAPIQIEGPALADLRILGKAVQFISEVR